MKRGAGKMAKLSGGDAMIYGEYARPAGPVPPRNVRLEKYFGKKRK